MYKQGLGLILGLTILVSSAVADVNPESIVQIFQRLELLEKKSRELTGENEVLKHQLDQLKKTQKQGFLNIDERIDEFAETLKAKNTPTVPVKKPETSTQATQTKTKPTEATREVKTGGVRVIPADPKNKIDMAAKGKPPEPTKAVTSTSDNKPSAKKTIRKPTDYEKETYQEAFNQMNKSPTGATKAFRDYIKLQPNSPLAANAQYWIGEIMYSHNNYKGAVKEFITVLQKYKDSNKAPDAAIKLGYSFYALKNWAYARRTFEDVLKYFPDNKNAVNLATQRLAKMKAAGN